MARSDYYDAYSGPKTAIDTARKAMRDRGYVVVGYEPGQRERRAGEMLEIFGGRLLPPNCHLVVDGPTDRADWDAQVVALWARPSRDRNPILEGQSFYRCSLVEAA